MQIRELLSDDDAVSPVIGVILMVAITVILAAVIASFVLGLGDQASQAQPQASFSFDYDGGGGGSGVLTVTHDGGDSIEGQELFVRGSGFDSGTSDISGSAGSWDAAGSIGSTDMVSAGTSVTVDASSDYEFSIVYEPVEGGNSATLAKDQGPDA